MTTIIGGAAGTPAGSLSELMQKGIYSEETKGDLDGAMQLYRQIVNDAKESQALAAQAQYRLGVCLYKKKSYTEAAQAFEKMVKDYPDQKELVTMAGEYLAGAMALLPPPWVDGEEMRLEIKFPTGFKLGMGAITVDAAETNGIKIWRLGSHLFAGGNSFSRVEVEADSFKPLHSRWKHSLIGDVDAVYSPGMVELRPQGKDEVKKVELKGLIYDNESAIQLMRRLPLASNYTTSVRFLASLSAGAVIPVKAEVTGVEKLEVPAGTFECYRVQLSIRQTFWYSTDAHRYLVKFEAGGVVAELTEVRQRKFGEPVKFQDTGLNISMVAPPDWIFHRTESQDEKGSVTVTILDPEAMGSGELEVHPLENLKPDERKSLRAWAETEAAGGAKFLKDFQLRTESWQERTLARQPAISVVQDFVEGDIKKVGYAVFSFGNTAAIGFHLVAPAKNFDALRPAFDGVIDSYKAN